MVLGVTRRVKSHEQNMSKHMHLHAGRHVPARNESSQEELLIYFSYNTYKLCGQVQKHIYSGEVFITMCVIVNDKDSR